MNRLTLLPSWLADISPARAPLLLALGLTLVATAQFVSLTPVLVGVALLMLGSTLAATERVPPQLRLLAMSINLIVYLGLYALFLGAVMHPSAPVAPSWIRLTDLGVSAWLVLLSLQLGVRQIQSAT
ncbi:MAG: hypothetical protein ACR2NU_01880 [Aeoliella sp.]